MPVAIAEGTRQPGPWVVLARIVRPQGRRGELLAELLTDFPERFAERKHLTLLGPKEATRPIELESHWLHQGRIVLKIAGVDSINDAETLRGWEITIPREERAPLEADSVYIDDLIGCLLFDRKSNTTIGTISGVDRESSTTDLLVVDTAAGEVLVPFVKAYRPAIDLTSRRIEMELPEGLLDLNTAGT